MVVTTVLRTFTRVEGFMVTWTRTTLHVKAVKHFFPGSVAEPGGEDNFGVYDTVNPVHRCTANENSTTQWWFGERV